MRVLLYLLLGTTMVGLAPRPASGQGLGLGASVHVGTLGLGAQLSMPLIGSQLRLRGGFDYQPLEIDVGLSDVRYDLDLPSPSLTAVLDWHPGGGSFRISGGVVYFTEPLELEATPTARVEIGAREYDPGEIGSLIGALRTSESGPYAGIGWGHGGGRRLALSLDLGLVYNGMPEVTLRATGPVAGVPAFQAQLEAEIKEIDELLEYARVYPVVNLGLSVGL